MKRERYSFGHIWANAFKIEEEIDPKMGIYLASLSSSKEASVVGMVEDEGPVWEGFEQ